jgi:hypothetical protein
MDVVLPPAVIDYDKRIRINTLVFAEFFDVISITETITYILKNLVCFNSLKIY